MPRWLDSGRLRSVELDRRGALALHRAVTRPRLRTVFTWASRLGDAPLWLVLIALQPLLDAVAGPRRALLLLGLGSTNLLIYWALKRSTRRQRPYEGCLGIRACMKVPDPFSFPSGHTLHAVAFGALLSVFFPTWAPLLWAFAGVVAVSRVALGLHYPSDVLMGALIGAATASLALDIGGAGWGDM
jgi:undecaprenyl-diphosphatase